MVTVRVVFSSHSQLGWSGLEGALGASVLGASVLVGTILLAVMLPLMEILSAIG